MDRKHTKPEPQLEDFKIPDAAPLEVQLLTELCAFPEFIPDAQALITPAVFVTPDAKDLYDHLTGLYSAGNSDQISLAAVYASAPNRDWYYLNILRRQANGGAAQVHELCRGLLSILEKRRAIDFVSSIYAAVAAGTGLQDIFNKAHDFEEEIQRAIPAGGTLTLKEVAGMFMDGLEKTSEYIPTGYISLDRITDGGLEGGNLVVIGARTSIGKTAIALDMAANMAEAGIPGVYFSLEIKENDIFRRLLLRTSCEAAPISKRDIKDRNYKVIESAVRDVERLQLMIDCTNRSLDQITSRIALLHSQGKIKFAVVDQLSLVAEEMEYSRNMTEVQAFSKVTKRLKATAMKLDMPIILLAQINRNAVNGPVDVAPELHHLKSSGAIEEDADIVLLVEPDKKAHAADPSTGEDNPYRTVWIRKNRNGRAGDYAFTLKANETYSRFNEWNGFVPPAQPAPATHAPAPAPAEAPANDNRIPEGVTGALEFETEPEPANPKWYDEH